MFKSVVKFRFPYVIKNYVGEVLYKGDLSASSFDDALLRIKNKHKIIKTIKYLDANPIYKLAEHDIAVDIWILAPVTSI